MNHFLFALALRTAAPVKSTYGHEHFVTLGQLPNWKAAK